MIEKIVMNFTLHCGQVNFDFEVDYVIVHFVSTINLIVTFIITILILLILVLMIIVGIVSSWGRPKNSPNFDVVISIFIPIFSIKIGIDRQIERLGKTVILLTGMIVHFGQGDLLVILEKHLI